MCLCVCVCIVFCDVVRGSPIMNSRARTTCSQYYYTAFWWLYFVHQLRAMFCGWGLAWLGFIMSTARRVWIHITRCRTCVCVCRAPRSPSICQENVRASSNTQSTQKQNPPMLNDSTHCIYYMHHIPSLRAQLRATTKRDGHERNLCVCVCAMCTRWHFIMLPRRVDNSSCVHASPWKVDSVLCAVHLYLVTLECDIDAAAAMLNV